MKVRLCSMCVAVGLVLGAVGSAQATQAPIPFVNGSFETGDFTGWTLTGNTGFAGVTCPGPSSIVAQGNCSSFLGAIGSLGFLNQTFSAAPNEAVTFNFAWSNDGGAPAEFSVELDGATLLDIVNPGVVPMHFQTVSGVTGAGFTHTLSFNERNDPGFMFLDAVSGRTPEPATIALLGLGLAGLAASRRRKTI